MRRELGLVLSLVLAASAGAFADDDAAAPEKDTRRHIQVLQDPHDISNFYTSSQSGPFDIGYGYDDDQNGSDPYAISSFYTQNPRNDRYPIARFYQQDSPTDRYPIAGFYRQDSPTGRYPIAGFYRQGATGRYSRYWTVTPRRRLVAPLGLRRLATRDLCFAAPTVLVPFVPFVQ